MEGTRVGIYDLTTMPTALLEEAAQTGKITIPGQAVTHTVSHNIAAAVLSTRSSRTGFAG